MEMDETDGMTDTLIDLKKLMKYRNYLPQREINVFETMLKTVFKTVFKTVIKIMLKTVFETMLKTVFKTVFEK